MKTVLKYVAAFPVFFIAVFVLNFFAALLNHNRIYHALAQITVYGAAIILFCEMLPKYKFRTTIVWASIISVLHALALCNPDINHSAHNVMVGICAIIGLWAGVYLVRETKPTPRKNNIKITAQDIEKELRERYPGLQEFFNGVFSWLYSILENENKKISQVITKKEKPVAAAIYALLFFQVTEQLKQDTNTPPVIFGHTPIAVIERRNLWKFLFDKVEMCHYIPADEMALKKKDMEPYLHG